ncbi:MAG: ABC transporter permease [Candidatus Nanohalobium sp.]
MGKYLEFVRMGFREMTAYRFNAVMSLVASILYLIMVYAIWTAIDASGQLAVPLSGVLTYILLGQVISNSVFTEVEGYLSERVREGTIVNELKRPVSLRLQIYCYLIGKMLFNTLTKGLPVLVIGLLFLDMQTPTPLNAAGFIVALILSFNLVFAFSFLTSMLVFWTEIGWGIRAMRSNIQDVFSGVLFPLYLLPGGLASVFDLLPFQAMADAPIRIFTMEATGREILNIFGLQVFWIIVIAVLGELAWRKAKTKLTVQGG